MNAINILQLNCDIWTIEFWRKLDRRLVTATTTKMFGMIVTNKKRRQDISKMDEDAEGKRLGAAILLMILIRLTNITF